MHGRLFFNGVGRLLRLVDLDGSKDAVQVKRVSGRTVSLCDKMGCPWTEGAGCFVASETG